MSQEFHELRDLAAKRVRDRRDFGNHMAAFVVVNLGLVAIWAVTAQGYFWPGWVLGLWSVGLVLHAWDAFLRKPITDADVEHEMERLRHRSGGSPAA
jgi:hypothetical protein